jgi:taurine--2-oxoglutarate transaminase
MSASDELAGRHRASVFFTWTAQRDAAPMEIVSGSGARFQTSDGASWLDFGSMVWNASLGHGHAGMKRALVAAAERGLVAMPSSIFPEKARAAELLLEVAPPGLRGGKAFLCLSGAEANENAVKMARMVTGRRKVLYRSRSYHGATLAMLSLSGDPRRAPFDPGLPDGVAWNDPYSAEPGAGDLERVLAREDPKTIAAVMLEGVVGANGVYVPPRGYWKRVREVCDRHRALLILDEVLSGFGRTGRWFAIDHDGVSPDILSCAKGLTAGYAPGGATLVTPAIARHFDDHVLSCGLTAYAHPLTCAAIIAAIEAYRREDLVSRAERLGALVEVQLRTMAETRPFVREVRGVGLLWAVELAAGSAEMKRLAEELRARHLHLHKRDNMVFVAPPLVIEEPDLQAGVATLGAALDAVWAQR